MVKRSRLNQKRSRKRNKIFASIFKKMNRDILDTDKSDQQAIKDDTIKAISLS